MGTVAPPACGPKYQTVVSTGVPIPGPVGPMGPSGLQGPQGAAGLPGAGLVVKGTVPTVQNPLTDLPQTGNHPGDGWIALDTGHIWTWSGMAWIDGGPFGGPPGPQGIPGVAGPTGPQGIQGVPGSSNPATTTTLGSVIVSSGLSVQGNGALSIATGTGSGLVLTGNVLSASLGSSSGLTVLPDSTLGVRYGAGLTIASGLLAITPATQLALGGVIVGSGLNVQANGTISVPIATATSPGLVSAGPGLNVQPSGALSVAAGAGLGLSGNNVVLMPATTSALGGIIVGSGLTVQANGTLSATLNWTPVSGGIFAAPNVGIGINPPAYALDVGGQIHTNVPTNSQAIILTSGTLFGSMGSRFGGMSLGTSSADSLVLYTSGAPRMTIASGGAVTISSQLTTNAGAMVQGPLQVGPNATLGQSGDISLSRASAPTTGTIYFGNSGTQALSFDGTNYSFQNAGVSAGGNLTIGGAINATGGINSSGNLSATGSVTAGTTIYANNAQIASALLTTGNQVGIGTWPVGTNALTVAGNLRLTNSGCLIFQDGTTQCTAGVTTQPAGTPHTPARSPNNSYANNTGVTMWVTVTFNNIASGSTAVALVGTGTPNIQVATAGGSAATSASLFFPVPNGYNYIVNTTMAVASWVEWY